MENDDNGKEKLSIGQRVFKWFFTGLIIVIVLGTLIQCGEKAGKIINVMTEDINYD